MANATQLEKWPTVRRCWWSFFSCVTLCHVTSLYNRTLVNNCGWFSAGLLSSGVFTYPSTQNRSIRRHSPSQSLDFIIYYYSLPLALPGKWTRLLQSPNNSVKVTKGTQLNNMWLWLPYRILYKILSKKWQMHTSGESNLKCIVGIDQWIADTHACL